MQRGYCRRRGAGAARRVALVLAVVAAAQPALANPSIVEWGLGRPAERQAARERTELVGQIRHRPQDAGLHLRHARLLAREYLGHRSADWRPAAAAFEFAVQLDPTLSEARLELGRFYAAVGRSGLAEQTLAEYVSLQGGDGAAFADLARAALRSGDLVVALWAGRKAASLSPRADELEAAALVSGALGAADAGPLMERLQSLDPARAARVARDVAAWRGAADLAAALPPPTPQAVPAAAPQAPAAAPGLPATSWPAASTPTLAGPVLAADWRACDPIAAAARAATYSSFSTTSYGQNSTYSTSSTTPLGPQALPPLAGPCAQTPHPPMAVIEAVIVRQVDETSESRGINLLSTLQLVARGRLRLAEERGSGLGSTTSNFLTLSLPDNGLTYLLDILDDRTVRTDVLAKPSLVALDRTPSLFFSGSTISVPISGQYSSSLEEKVIGVSLAVTPTFLSDDEMLLAVNAGRSFLENGLDAQLEQGIQTSANSVTANVRMRFGETLVLSGLVEREEDTSRSETPLLGRLPLGNLFLAERDRRSLRHNLVVLLTPRRPNESGQDRRADDSLMPERHDRRLAEAVAALARSDTPEAAALDDLSRRLARADLLDKLPITATTPPDQFLLRE